MAPARAPSSQAHRAQNSQLWIRLAIQAAGRSSKQLTVIRALARSTGEPPVVDQMITIITHPGELQAKLLYSMPGQCPTLAVTAPLCAINE